MITSQLFSVPGMDNDLTVEVRYVLGRRNCQLKERVYVVRRNLKEVGYREETLWVKPRFDVHIPLALSP